MGEEEPVVAISGHLSKSADEADLARAKAMINQVIGKL